MRGVVLHTVGVKGDASAASIRKYHMTPEKDGGPKGGPWRDIGYHFVIRKDGMIEPGRPLTQNGAHTEGANDTIGVCVTGDGDREGWTLAQVGSVRNLCAKLLRERGLGIDKLCGHREAERVFKAKPTHKTCPGKLVDLDAVRKAVAEKL